MSAFKGTPGPWEVVKDDYSDQYIRQKAGTRRLSGFIVECRICEDVSNDDDARLIAAAPCLLDALQRLNSATRRYMEERPESDAEWASDEPSVLSIVDAAIAKATGGTP